MDHIRLLKELFEYTNGFSLGLYEDFLGEMCKTYDREQKLLPIEKNEESAIAQKMKLRRYKDNQGKNIDFLVFKLKDGRSIQKARHLQRNVISSYLKDYGVYSGVDHVIAVFYADGHPDWRLSFVKQQFKLDPEKKKVVNEFTPAKRFSFLIEKGSKNQTIRKQSLELLKASDKPNINEIEKMFSVEKVTKEFFDNYKGLYSKLKEAFEHDRVFDFMKQKYNQGDPHFTENFVKKLLGQIVFLYFLQKKGWMGVGKDKKRGEGDKQFLRTLYEKCVSEKKLFFNDYLEPLFYNTLNNSARPGHWSDYFGSKIPYLNGGLFQPINDYNWDGVENVLLSSDMANGIFGEILDTFDTFNFTIYENDPLEQDVAVDPEMLGKIFENLLPDNERKGKGAFYTPREIVHYMCKQALIQYLVTETGIEEKWIENLMLIKDSLNNTKKIDEFGGDEAKKQVWKQNGEAINNALKEVRIVDPAVGSGAFPMGILKEIVDIRRYILTNIIPEAELEKSYMLLYKLKKETLSHCIYGVDLDPGAVDIAKLRFWLSLVVDYEGDHIEPLPNLDYKIMQGNSLIENPVIGNQVIDLGLEQKNNKLSQKERKQVMRDGGLFEGMVESSMLLKKLTILHGDYFKETSPEYKKRLKVEIHNLEERLILQKAKETIDNLESEIQNNYRSEVGAKKANDLALIYKTINEIKHITNRLIENGVKNYFPWRLHFGEIFRDHGGFDIVIGNPPYVQIKKIKNGLDYGKCNYTVYSKSTDIYCLFYELGINLLKDNRVLSYITSNKWLRSSYGTPLRSLIGNYKVGQLIDLGPGVFETATVDTNIIIFSKDTGSSNLSQCVSVDASLAGTDLTDLKFTEIAFDPNGIWTILSPQQVDLKNKINTLETLASTDVEFYYGILTGANDTFIINENKKIDLISKDNKNTEIIVPLLRGQDIVQFGYNFSGYYLLNTHSSIAKKNIDYVDIENYPSIKDYLDSFGQEFKARGEQGNNWYNLRRCSYIDIFNKPKIIYSDIVQDEGKFYLDTEGYYTNDTAFIIYHEDTNFLYYLTGLLNSKAVTSFYARFYSGGTLGSKGVRYKKEFLGRVPLPIANIEQQQKMVSLVKEAINSKKSNNNLNIRETKNQIDSLVYELYDLTPEEIELIETSVKN